MSRDCRWMRRVWRTATLAACLVALAATVVAAPAAAKRSGAGRLDPSFGQGGKAMVPFRPQPSGPGPRYELPFQAAYGTFEMAPGGAGKTVIAGDTELVQLLADGRPDLGFGARGGVAYPVPPRTRFALAGVAVDSTGRVLVAGSARSLTNGSTQDPLAALAMVMRFRPDGSPDPSFGRDGLVLTDLGREAPLVTGGFRYPAPAVGLEGIAVDAADRPVLTGAWVSDVTTCYTSAQQTIDNAFVARLGLDGKPDPSFGQGGMRPLPGLTELRRPSLLAGGSTLVAGTGRYLCPHASLGPLATLTALDPSGNPDPALGGGGSIQVNFAAVPKVATTPDGRIVLFGRSEFVGGKPAPDLPTKLVRLLPGGAFDPSFGRNGRLTLKLPQQVEIDAIATDARGRILLAGTMREKEAFKHPKFLLMRRTATGKLDRGFGRGGSVVTGFGGRASANGRALYVGGGNRIVVGGPVSSPRLSSGSGYAIARYLGGR